MAVDNVETAFRLPNEVNEDFTGIYHGSNSTSKTASKKYQSTTKYQPIQIRRCFESAKVSCYLRFRDSASSFIKIETRARMFSCEIIKSTFFIEHIRATASGRAQDFIKNGPNSNS